MFEFSESRLSGCFLVKPKLFSDKRGSFVKTFAEGDFHKIGLKFELCEQFFSISNLEVIRGLHFQHPPYDHAKLVFCLVGSVQDVVVDIRIGSPTYGQFAEFSLSAENSHGVFIPSGFAHGFCSTSPNSLMIYNVSTGYAPQHDDGIRWDSLRIPWEVKNPIVSDRDSNFVEWINFKSPFVWKGPL